MSNNKQVFHFKNRNGDTLIGTLHTPIKASPELPIIVLLSPGIKMRVGPHRLYNRMTAKFNDLGFTVFKFDFTGLGDSEGELEREFLHEVYNMTETGFFVNDSVDALDFLRSTLKANSFVVGGLCGGAITGLLLAEKDSRVIGLISLAMTVTLSSGPGDRSKYAGTSELEALGRGYIQKLFDPKAWLRLLSLKTDFRTLSRSIRQLLFGRNSPVDRNTNSDPDKNPTTNANPLFPSAFFSLLESGRKILLIYSKADRTYWDFQEKFAAEYKETIDGLAHPYEMHLIESANHVLSFREWENQVHDIAIEWLTENYVS
jgi:pimeloyl-ACP methyl ester carboxylesterase